MHARSQRTSGWQRDDFLLKHRLPLSGQLHSQWTATREQGGSIRSLDPAVASLSPSQLPLESPCCCGGGETGHRNFLQPQEALSTTKLNSIPVSRIVMLGRGPPGRPAKPICKAQQMCVDA